MEAYIVIWLGPNNKLESVCGVYSCLGSAIHFLLEVASSLNYDTEELYNTEDIRSILDSFRMWQSKNMPYRIYKRNIE